MRVSLIKTDRIRSIDIPDNISGSFWLKDYDDNGKEVNLISIKQVNGKWCLISNQEIVCAKNNSFLENMELVNYGFGTIQRLADRENMLVYTTPSKDNNFAGYYLNPVEGTGYSIGNAGCNINYFGIDNNQARLVFENNKYVLYNMSQTIGTYVNNIRVHDRVVLEFGDIVFIGGLKFIYVKENNYYKLIFYHYGSNLSVQGLTSANSASFEDEFEEAKEDLDMKWYTEDDYFHKTPRFLSSVTEKEIRIDVPPAKQEEPDTPVILTIGPMLTMSMSSIVNMLVSVNNLKSNGGSLISTLPSIVMAFAMLASTLLWPSFTRKFENKKRIRKEAERVQKYSKYIDKKRTEILEEYNNQTNSLRSNYPSLQECNSIILNKKDELWQKKIEDADFLDISLGYGSYPMKLKISYPEEQFSMVEDDLKEMADKLCREPKILENVPVNYSLIDTNISSIVGNYSNRNEYLRKLLLQIVTFHSYIDLKLVIFTDNDKKSNWEHINNLPHCFTDDKQMRFFASNKEEYSYVCDYLEKVYNARKEAKVTDSHKCDKIYLIITDSFKMLRSMDFINTLLDEKESLGFSFIISNRNIATLPEQCKSFINVDTVNGSLSKNIINDKKQEFIIDTISAVNYNDCFKVLSNTPIETKDNGSGAIPDKLGFLEMFDVGMIEHLNSLNRWKKSNPMQTLKTEVGYGKNDTLQYIDLHEKAHGPHGLVAGMTGSGKSEFIISYILSLAVNYHPHEVQFILIDYKGGGLAGAFENANSGKKLPHLVGVITNLDKSEIKRTISSIESELKRRQRLFNIARDNTGESTVDIYKYQRLYREGKVDEPISHLFIISDEFAELKTQQPEFMEQLISTARIGRSLGVHLILATQKPSGVVDPQIWSNTRFRVCLRVQDKGDSNEVIKCPDAAFLKQTGRFYFQVGYNEVFTLGQAAWAGGKYIPAEKTMKPIDSSIEFIDNVGKVIKKIDTKEVDKTQKQNDIGEELSNVVNYLYDMAKEENIKTKPLWLDKIPAFIKISNLISKYNFVTHDSMLDIPIGEYDIPSEQTQNLLTVNFNAAGNTLVYGASGSGKENFLTTMIYTSMKLYNPQDVNYYVLDFGAEVLKVFRNSPYVGDIVSIDEEEKVKNLFKMITSMVEQRKDLLSKTGSDFISYNKKASKKLPNVVVILNNYEAYQDTYSDYDDMLNTITRECSKYGIYFLITCNTPNGLRFKLKQNFSSIYCLQQNNEDDYSSILGNVHKNFPSKLFGRGIIKVNGDVFEFQTAQIDEKENVNTEIEKVINEVKSKTNYTAKKIPTLPDFVTYEDVKDVYDSSTNLVIGIEKNELDVMRYNISKNLINVITTNDATNLSSFVNAFLNQLKHVKGCTTHVLAASDFGIKDSTRQGISYEDTNLNEMFENILNFEIECLNLYESNNFNKRALVGKKPKIVVINGIDALKSKLNADNKLKFSDFFTKAKDLDLVRYIIIDELDKIKKVEFEAWYKDGFNPNEGIWIGDGINDQFTLKPLVRTPEMKLSIDDDFCFVLQKGKPYLVKYLQSFEYEEEEEFIEEL